MVSKLLLIVNASTSLKYREDFCLFRFLENISRNSVHLLISARTNSVISNDIILIESSHRRMDPFTPILIDSTLWALPIGPDSVKVSAIVIYVSSSNETESTARNYKQLRESS